MSSGEVVRFATSGLLKTDDGVDTGDAVDIGVDLCWSFLDDSDCCWIEEGMNFDLTVGT